VSIVLGVAFVFVCETIDDWLPFAVTQIPEKGKLHGAINPKVLLRHCHSDGISSEKERLKPALVQRPIAYADVLYHLRMTNIFTNHWPKQICIGTRCSNKGLFDVFTNRDEGTSFVQE
jgi:hypothetical protein